MNKKILIGIIAVLVVAGAGIYAINANTKNTNDNSSKITETSPDASDNSSNCDSSKSKDCNSNSESNNTSNSEVAVTPNDETATTMEELDAAANAEIASDKDKAIKKLLDYYLGIDNSFTQNTIKVKVVTNSDNSISITKTNEDSNTYYAGISAFSDTSSEGLILTIENYNESDKVYSYSIKDLSDLKSGKTDNIVDSGSIPEKGAVTSNKNK